VDGERVRRRFKSDKIMKTLTQFKKELIAERPQLEEMIANDLAELRLSEQLRQL
jgi:hypothetical protein